MVPNHTGIDSDWVMYHPDRFVQLNHSPYSGYSFEGPDLSLDPRISLHIEDGYWNRSDAAVVFRRVDHEHDDTRFIYHGNDGTQMPWNDTAQLDFLREDVRDAIVETILEVAKRFDVIRFDAAMTLTKMHYQRLWYPKPGTGGGVPSRAAYGLSDEDFNAAMPYELWRRVVDTVAEQQPETLLLAEAFWMTESFFVRKLGMHRVYNSAFMNMLKAEENAKYREYVREILDYSPEVIRRYVNFMSNPDEETAIQQFGDGDKYFGVATMCVTMPGLPMFGHGQVEGFTERYGMEYRRAYHDEKPRHELVRRHEREIVPLLKRRDLFSGVEHFQLYDFAADGKTNENVFAYSNRSGSTVALVLYNNRLDSTEGRISDFDLGVTEMVDLRSGGTVYLDGPIKLAGYQTLVLFAES